MAKRRREALQIIRGTIGTLLINTVMGVVCILLHSVSVLFTLLLSAIGLSQFLYLTPLLIAIGVQERWGQMKGVWIGAGITALANVGYYLFWVLKR